jgi:hypothetical protein
MSAGVLAALTEISVHPSKHGDSISIERITPPSESRIHWSSYRRMVVASYNILRGIYIYIYMCVCVCVCVFWYTRELGQNEDGNGPKELLINILGYSVTEATITAAVAYCTSPG